MPKCRRPEHICYIIDLTEVWVIQSLIMLHKFVYTINITWIVVPFPDVVLMLIKALVDFQMLRTVGLDCRTVGL